MQTVDELMATLEHPQKAAIELLRTAITEADPSIVEGVKWNAPSFRVRDWFATINLRPTTVVRVVLHTGAKAVPGHPDVTVDDPEGLLRWLGKDRAMLSFHDVAEVEAKRSACTAVVRQWVGQLPA
jgi:hypothetical protein